MADYNTAHNDTLALKRYPNPSTSFQTLISDPMPLRPKASSSASASHFPPFPPSSPPPFPPSSSSPPAALVSDSAGHSFRSSYFDAVPHTNTNPNADADGKEIMSVQERGRSLQRDGKEKKEKERGGRSPRRKEQRREGKIQVDKHAARFYPVDFEEEGGRSRRQGDRGYEEDNEEKGGIGIIGPGISASPEEADAEVKAEDVNDMHEAIFEPGPSRRGSGSGSGSQRARGSSMISDRSVTIAEVLSRSDSGSFSPRSTSGSETFFVGSLTASGDDDEADGKEKGGIKESEEDEDDEDVNWAPKPLLPNYRDTFQLLGTDRKRWKGGDHESGSSHDEDEGEDEDDLSVGHIQRRAQRDAHRQGKALERELRLGPARPGEPASEGKGKGEAGGKLKSKGKGAQHHFHHHLPPTVFAQLLRHVDFETYLALRLTCRCWADSAGYCRPFLGAGAGAGARKRKREREGGEERGGEGEGRTRRGREGGKRLRYDWGGSLVVWEGGDREDLVMRG